MTVVAPFFCGAAQAQKATARTTPTRIVPGKILQAPQAGQAPADFLFRNGDRPVAFLGDSITEARMYPALIEAYMLTRFPNWNVSFRNIGWSGDTADLRQRGGLDNGLKRDILSLRPASITIDFGMNDARGGDAAYQRFIDSSTRLVRELKAAGSRVALVSPSPEEKYEADQPAGSAYNRMLAKYSAGLKEIAAREGVPYVDQLTPFIQVIESGRKAGVLGANDLGPRLIPDSVHPNWAGHLVMATSILKGLNAPSLVSRVEINAKGGVAQIVQTQNASVTLARELTSKAASDRTIAFTRTDDASPWPIPDEAAVALQIPGFTPLADLSRYELKVTNLVGPSYDVMIDDEKAGTFSRAELAAGVNLSNASGPVAAQGKKLLSAIMAKNQLYFMRWRMVQIYDAPLWLSGEATETARNRELARLDAQIAQAETQINELRRPLPHLWKLVPTPPQAPADVKITPASATATTPASATTPATGVKLSWRDAADDERGFSIEKSSDGLAFSPLAQVGANVSSFEDRDADLRAPLYYRVRALGANSRSAWTTASNAWTGSGLKAEYFGDVALKNRILSRTDAQIDFDWNRLAPDRRVGRENFSVRWSGQVQPKSSGLYTFHVTSDDGARLWVNDQKLIDQWMEQGATEMTGATALQANRKYAIRLEYYQGGGGAQASLEWSAPAQPRQIIPQSQLYPAS